MTTEYRPAIETSPTVHACVACLERVNADAERDIEKGNPITGAHHRAILRELARLEALRSPIASNETEARIERPTISELEAILADETRVYDIELQPNGEIRAINRVSVGA